MGSIQYTSVTGKPITVEVDDQWVEIVTALDRQGYNNERGYHRQDRKGVRLCSYEAFNEYGNQSAGSSASAEEEAVAHEAESDFNAVTQLLHEAIDTLPPAWRELLLQIFLKEKQQANIAAARGVSKPTITKQKNKALAALKSALEERGVNAAMVRGLLADQAQGLVQKRESR